MLASLVGIQPGMMRFLWVKSWMLKGITEVMGFLELADVFVLLKRACNLFYAIHVRLLSNSFIICDEQGGTFLF